MGRTTIEWCQFTFNAWRGCTKVSDGCKHCYAETLSGRNPRSLGVWGPSGTRVVAAESYWREPAKWDKAAAAAGDRHRVFCLSLGDVFEDWDGVMMSATGLPLHDGKRWHAKAYWVPKGMWIGQSVVRMADVRGRLGETIVATPNLDWLLVTKRPENILRMWSALFGSYGDRKPRANVWLLASVEDQAAADKRIPELLKCRDLVPVLGLSMEPLLGRVDLHDAFYRPRLGPDDTYKRRQTMGIDWVIVGGESGAGHKTRPMHPDWARSIRDQCVAAGVAFHFKQWGEWLPYDMDAQPPFWSSAADGSVIDGHVFPDGLADGDPVGGWLAHDMAARDDNQVVYRFVGKKAAGRLLDGKEHNEFPAPSPVLGEG